MRLSTYRKISATGRSIASGHARTSGWGPHNSEDGPVSDTSADSDSLTGEPPGGAFRVLRSLGPALIVAAVVLGPGSILTSSKVGCEYGYDMLWVLAGAAALMAGTTAIAATLGQALPGTLCGELASRLGRPAAAFVGITLFLIVACFQSSNNLAVLAGIEPVIGSTSPAIAAGILIAINIAIGVVLFASRDLYRHVETLMKILVGLMAIGFAINLAFAKPSIGGVAKGLVPSVPAEARGFLPTVSEGAVVDPWWAVQGMIATTFSIAGAFYQSYLVREKGWNASQLRQGLADSICGIAALGIASSMILVTSASVLHGNVDVSTLKSAGDVSAQLRPLFGTFATMLFSMGILAGAFSSFLINAMIGGTLLADGFGWKSSLRDNAMKWSTIGALLVGCAFAIGMNSGAVSKIDVIVFAQALTVLGGPVLAFTLLYLATKLSSESRGRWIYPIAGIACVVTLLLAARTGWRIWLTLNLPS